MLNLKARAEVRGIKLGKDTRSDNIVKTITLKLRMEAVPLETVTAGFVSQLSLFYDISDALRFDDVEELRCSRHIANVTMAIAGLSIEKMIIDHVRLMPLQNRLVKVELWAKGEIATGLDALHDVLLSTTEVELIEHEYEVAEDEGELEDAAA